PLDKVWAFPAPQGEILRQRVDRYFAQLQEAGALAPLVDRHFEHLDRLDAYSRNAFRERVESRLPAFRELLESAAQRHGLDWRFLAAVAYQESQWDPDAVSATGVRGLMMLTRRTAREVGVRDRKDPRESIDGGAQYFVNLHARVSPDAPEPDRTWMTLAAYNLGFGHLLDLQRLTAHLGGDPLRWTELRSHLLKLSQPRWYRHEVVRYGYARGAEARSYVANIRAYYDLLRWRFPAAGETALDVEQPIAPFRLELAPADESQRLDTLVPAL
ncbi:MAG: transglycosylase SLT domain-containing protein, partial [Oceanococcaceae bacterium]